jgi:alkylhydroperoxidase family enzyme
VLAERFYTPDEVAGIARGTYSLDQVDSAVMELAAKVAADATSVTQSDVDRLRELGLSDADVVDIVLAAAIRSFFTKTLDSLGAEPDASFRELDPVLRETLTVGRAIADD